MTEPCLYDQYAATRGEIVAPCRGKRSFDTPFCFEHLHRVAWLSLGIKPQVVVEVERRVEVVPPWIIAILLIAMWSLVCTGG